MTCCVWAVGSSLLHRKSFGFANELSKYVGILPSVLSSHRTHEIRSM